MLSSVVDRKQKGPLCDRKGKRANVAPYTQEAPLMRLSVTSLRRTVKRPLHVEFGPQQLTSYSGLELLRRYLRRHDLPRRLRAACAATGGDYGGGRLARLVLALLYVGARRLEHLRYVAGDPLIARFCGLARIPTARTVGNWLRQFSQSTLGPLVQLNHDLVIDAVRRLALPRLTIDLDGTVVRTGATVGWAFRGFNPHHRKDPSYYPLLAHVAQTGHILRVKNRPGNVHDSKQSVAFLREVIDGLRTAFGRRVPSAGRPGLCLCHQGRVLALAAPEATRRRTPALARRGPARHRLLPRPGHPPVEPLPAGDDLPQARGPREPQELPARSLHPRRWPRRVPRRRHEPGAGPAGPLRLHLRPRRAGEDDRRAQGRVRAGRRSHAPLRRQQCLAATQYPRPQPHPELPARYPGHAQTPLAQTHLYVPDPKHAHPALPARRQGRPAHPSRRSPRPAPLSQPGHGGPLCVDQSPLGRLSYFRIGASLP